jgi:hypothetical protein
MQLFLYIVVLVVAAVISNAMRPRPPEPKAAALDELDIPTAEEGRPIPVVFGCVLIKSPNVVWAGDLAVDPIRTVRNKK